MDDLMQEISTQAAEATARAMSMLLAEPISVDIRLVESGAERAGKLPIRADDPVSAVFVPLTGDISGAALLLVPKTVALAYCDMMCRRAPGTTRHVEEIEESALKELGNIIAGNYLAVFSNSLGVRIVEHTPNYSIDMFGALWNQVNATVAQRAEDMMITEVELVTNASRLKAYFILLLSADEVDAVLSRSHGDLRTAAPK